LARNIKINLYYPSNGKWYSCNHHSSFSSLFLLTVPIISFAYHRRHCSHSLLHVFPSFLPFTFYVYFYIYKLLRQFKARSDTSSLDKSALSRSNPKILLVNLSTNFPPNWNFFCFSFYDKIGLGNTFFSSHHLHIVAVVSFNFFIFYFCFSFSHLVHPPILIVEYQTEVVVCHYFD